MIIKTISHRGLPSKFCENSVEALCEKLHNRWDGVELDVQFTLDKKIVIFHDETLKRIYQVDHTVTNTTYDDIVALSAHHPNGTIGTLETFLAQIADIPTATIIDIELKFFNPTLHNALELYHAVSSMVDQFQLHHHVILTSFYQPFIEHSTCKPIFENAYQYMLNNHFHGGTIVNHKDHCHAAFWDTAMVDIVGVYTFNTRQERLEFAQNLSHCNMACKEVWLITNQ